MKPSLPRRGGLSRLTGPAPAVSSPRRPSVPPGPAAPSLVLYRPSSSRPWDDIHPAPRRSAWPTPQRAAVIPAASRHCCKAHNHVQSNSYARDHVNSNRCDSGARHCAWFLKASLLARRPQVCTTAPGEPLDHPLVRPATSPATGAAAAPRSLVSSRPPPASNSPCMVLAVGCA